MTRAIPVPMLCVLALLSAIAPLATDMYLPALPSMTGALDTSDTSVQLTLATFMAGLGVGQLIIGPLSDGLGRRKLLVFGTALCSVSGVLCAIAPTIEILIAARLLQGFSGGAGIVLARAVIADRAKGEVAARLFSIMMIIGGVAPVVAPLMGGVLLGPIGWRGIFWVLAGASIVMLVGVLTLVPETLPKERRHGGGLAALTRNVNYVVRNRVYVGYALTFAFGFGALFSYISASSFVVQDVMGLSPGQFSIVFAINSAGIVAGSIVNTKLIGTFQARQLLTFGVTLLVTSGVLLLLATTLGGARIWLVLPLLFGVVTSIGFIMGNATALAQGQVPEAAGTGSALMGACQFGLAAVVSPLVGGRRHRRTDGDRDRDLRPDRHGIPDGPGPRHVGAGPNRFSSWSPRPPPTRTSTPGTPPPSAPASSTRRSRPTPPGPPAPCGCTGAGRASRHRPHRG